MAMAAPRVAEPWLTGFTDWRPCTATRPAGRVVEKTSCGPIPIPPDLVSIAIGECDRFMKTETDAVRLLAYVPQCTDAAVERLHGLAKPGSDGRWLSDLSAAYYMRAQRNDQPSDFVRALDAAEQALKLVPRSMGARFNRALAEEALGLSADAIKAWDDLRHEPKTPWRREAEQRHAALNVQKARSAAIQWPLNVQRLPLAARAGDARAVRQLVGPYRAAAHHYIEEEVLPAWADAEMHGREDEAAEQLTLATMIATAMARSTDDSYLLDMVKRIASAKSDELSALARAHLLYREARGEERVGHSAAAAVGYERAESALTQVASPLRFSAMLGHATALALNIDLDRALALLRVVERDAKRHHHPYLLARVHTGRGYIYTVQGRYLDSLAEYSAAQALFERTHDDENLSNVFARKIGLFRLIGSQEPTWREVFHALRHAESIFEPQSRHFLLGESAASAVDLGYPEVGLRYQNVAVRLLEDTLSRNTDESRVASLRLNLGVALRARAAVRVRLHDNSGAQADLDTAVALIGKPADPRETAIPSGMRARIAEVQAQTLAPKDRPRAIAAFGEAIREASTTHYRTLIASLLIQRAQLYRLEQNHAAALADLQQAIAALRKEEQAVLLGRHRAPEAETLWSAYFSRFQEAYRQLIQYLADDGADSDAFAYAEKARAFELLQLVLQRNDVPEGFRQSIRDGEPYGLEEMRRALPAGTCLLEYAVLDDRTYVWIVRGDGPAERRTLPVGERDIANWTSTLQRLASQRDVERFEAALDAPYKGLLQDVLAHIAAPAKGGRPRLVIIPDRSMHGLPFAALRNDTHYLVESYIVSVAPSATLYAYSLAQDRQLSVRPRGSLLLIDDPWINVHLDLTRNLPPLHATQHEAARIAAVYAGSMHVDDRKEKQATVPEFLRLARGSSIIHIAAHGVANPDVPSRSFLLLAPTENDSGALDAERLLDQLRLERTRLVVLSACSSAGGTPVGPEGLAPLVRPLVAAGVPGVVGTLWNVGANSATEQLVVRFHQHYREGRDAGDALRLAQLDMLHDTDLERSSVVAWAPFQMVGFASSPFLK